VDCKWLWLFALKLQSEDLDMYAELYEDSNVAKFCTHPTHVAMITDDELKRFANGQLPPDEEARIAIEIANSESLQARLVDLTLAHAITPSREIELRSRTKSLPTPNHTGSSNRIGNYRLLQVIGEGGMGQVWMAEQTEPVKRRVALKLIKSGKDSKPIIARFEAERQALALMDHISIARILDGGTSEDGQPYFVMELVPGIPITTYCDKHQLTLPKRLDIFQQVCNAVQHAHQKGIIHRDLKPSNILVATYDGKPIPKVIDFGLAKALDHGSKLTDKTLFTEFGAVVGTLQYMSPEQAELDAVDIDTRTDVYALGVLLYELLTGFTPIDPDSARQMALIKILESIRQTDPPRPSHRLSSSGEKLAEISSRRQIDPSRLQQELRGDLDWIVMKALEKDRDRRYETANGFAADIARYLTNQPVLARPPSTVYKLQKFYRKNQGPVIAASAMMLLLVAGLVGTLWGLREAREQTAQAIRSRVEADQAARDATQSRDAEKTQRETAERNLARAEKAETETKERVAELEELTNFQQSQLSGIDVPLMAVRLRRSILDQVADRVRNSNVTEDDSKARQLSAEQSLAGVNFVDVSLALLRENIFETAIKTAEDKYKSRPLFVASMFEAIGLTAAELGLVELVEKPVTETLRIRRTELGDEHPNTLLAISNMAVFLEGRGMAAEAEPLYRECLEKSRSIFGSEHPRTLDCMNIMAIFLNDQGRASEAEPLYRNTLDQRRKVLGNEDPSTLASITDLASFLNGQGKVDEAEPLFRESLEQHRHILGSDHPSTLKSIKAMGMFLGDSGKPREAEPLYREVLEKSRRILGELHPSTLLAIDNLAFFLKKYGRVKEAEPLYLEGLDKQRRVFGDEHPNTLTSANNMASFFNSQNRFDEAAPLFRDVLQTCRRVLGENHPKTLSAMNNLAHTLSSQGKDSEGESIFREILQKSREMIGDEHPGTLVYMNNLGQVLYKLGKVSEAEQIHRMALEIRRRKMGDEHPDTLYSINNLAACLDKQGKKIEAEVLYFEVLEKCEHVFGSEHPNTLAATSSVASFSAQSGKIAKAEQLYRLALEKRNRVSGSEHAETLSAMNNLALFLDGQDRSSEAEPLYREVLEARSKTLGPSHTATLKSTLTLGNFLSRTARWQESETILRSTFDQLVIRLGIEQPESLQFRVALAQLLVSTNRATESLELLSPTEIQFAPGVVKTLMMAHEQLGQEVEVISIGKRVSDSVRDQYSKEPARLAGLLLVVTRGLNRIAAYELAEPLGREMIESANRGEIEDWILARMKSTLGDSLLGLGRTAEAAEFIQASHELIVSQATKIPIETRKEWVSDSQSLLEKWKALKATDRQ
jgi:eukaryotic-like serine/threonine-protein kinase